MENEILNQVLIEIREIKSDLNEVKKEVKELREELRKEVSDLRNEINELRIELKNDINIVNKKTDRTERNLIKEINMQIRFVFEDIDIVDNKLNRVIERNRLVAK